MLQLKRNSRWQKKASQEFKTTIKFLEITKKILDIGKIFQFGSCNTVLDSKINDLALNF